MDMMDIEYDIFSLPSNIINHLITKEYVSIYTLLQVNKRMQYMVFPYCKTIYLAISKIPKNIEMINMVKNLIIYNDKQIYDLKHFDTLVNLKISGITQINNLPLSLCTLEIDTFQHNIFFGLSINLTKLSINGNYHILNIGDIINLQELIISGNKPCMIYNTENCKYLSHLTIEHNNFKFCTVNFPFIICLTLINYNFALYLHLSHTINKLIIIGKYNIVTIPPLLYTIEISQVATIKSPSKLKKDVCLVDQINMLSINENLKKRKYDSSDDYPIAKKIHNNDDILMNIPIKYHKSILSNVIPTLQHLKIIKYYQPINFELFPILTHLCIQKYNYSIDLNHLPNLIYYENKIIYPSGILQKLIYNKKIINTKKIEK